MGAIVLKNLTKTYDKSVTVIADLNLEITDGEFLVLVGPSGCGKSTTLRMIAGLEDITSGEIYIEDRQVNEIPPKDRDIAMVFQNYALYPHMTVRKNMAFGLKLRKMKPAEINQRVTDAANMLEITDLLERMPKQLSGGQKQRVALGRAIVRQPKAFLFDEPLSNLDAKLRVQMRAQIKSLHNLLKTTVVYVTHDQIEAMTMGDRIVILHEGIIQQVGSPGEIYDHPANMFVAGFIGSPPMNFLPVTARREQGLVLANGNGGQSLKAYPELASEYDGRQLQIGIRPEDLALVAPGSSEAHLTAPVQLLELLGHETLVHVQAGEANLVVKSLDVPPDLKTSSQVGLRFNLDRLHLFASEDGRVLTPSA